MLFILYVYVIYVFFFYVIWGLFDSIKFLKINVFLIYFFLVKFIWDVDVVFVIGVIVCDV